MKTLKKICGLMWWIVFAIVIPVATLYYMVWLFYFGPEWVTFWNMYDLGPRGGGSFNFALFGIFFIATIVSEILAFAPSSNWYYPWGT